MIEARWFEAGEAYTESMAVRQAVFVEEQGYSVQEEFDAADEQVPHLVLFDGQKPVATGRLILQKDSTAKLGRIAVLKPYRGQHLGARLVELLLERAKQAHAKRAYVSAQAYAVPFYRHFGFQEYGEPYLDGKIPHMDMEFYF